jgi:hypothetical protein
MTSDESVGYFLSPCGLSGFHSTTFFEQKVGKHVLK